MDKQINRRIDASAPPETTTVTIEPIDDDETSAELAAHIENVVAETG